MRIKVNGELIEITIQTPQPMMDQVINQLEFNPKLVVVELNGTILPPSNWSKQEICDGDVLEVVTIVGGGA